MKLRNQKALPLHPEVRHQNLLWWIHQVMLVSQPGSISTWTVATIHAREQTCTLCLWQDRNWPRREKRPLKRPKGKQSRKPEKRGKEKKKKRRRERGSGSVKEKRKELRRRYPAPPMKAVLESLSSAGQHT